MNMKILDAGGTLLGFILPLLVWRLLCNQGVNAELAALILLPFFIMVFIGCYRISLKRRQAELRVALQPDSFLVPWFRGIFSTIAMSFFLAGSATVLLGYRVLTVQTAEFILVCLLALSSLLLYRRFRQRLARHVNPAFLSSIATWLSVGISGGIFLLPHAWVSWSLTRQFGLQSKPEQIMDNVLQQMDDGGGLVTGFLSMLSAFEAAQLWLLVQLLEHGFMLPTLIYLAYGATICFLVARSVVAIDACHED